MYSAEERLTGAVCSGCRVEGAPTRIVEDALWFSTAEVYFSFLRAGRARCAGVCQGNTLTTLSRAHAVPSLEGGFWTGCVKSVPH